jgi:hypothetical protein
MQIANNWLSIIVFHFRKVDRGIPCSTLYSSGCEEVLETFENKERLQHQVSPVPVDAHLQAWPSLVIKSQDNASVVINVARILIFNARSSTQPGSRYLNGYLLILPCV